MKVLHSIAELAEIPGPLCIAIGVFDGVHLGHQALIQRAMDEAAAIGGTPVVLTFHPHPVKVLRPDAAPRLLTSTPHKIRLIEQLGCPYLLQANFDAKFAAQPPEVFIEDLVVHAKPLGVICVGHNWAFGKGRSGNVELLTELGQRFGYKTVEIEPVTVDDELVSSTRIRQAVEEGAFVTAWKLLGRDYTVLGTVQHGAGLGGKIGFPTANLAAHNEQFPPNGVYAVSIFREGQELKGVANVGTRPTVTSAAERLLEVNIFDLKEDLYGQDIEVRFDRFLRPEQKFDSVDALKAQIKADAEEARRLN